MTRILVKNLTIWRVFWDTHYPRIYFKSSYQASKVIKSTKAQYSRKRSGEATIAHHEIASLIDLFGLGSKFDYTLFQLSLEEFKQALKDAGTGTYGLPLRQHFRNELLAAADEESRVKFLKMANRKSVGGIGGQPSEEMIPTFNIFDNLRIRVQAPKDGYLLVLNDHPASDQLSILKPSRFIPFHEVDKGTVVLPDDIGTEAFPVGGPAGFYRIFTIWWKEPITPFLGDTDPELDLAPTTIRGADLERLIDFLGVAQRTEPRAEVMCGDYFVKTDATA
ncbi:MAG: hypothetical protein AAF423_06535 [Pseudomonadota bacterium]